MDWIQALILSGLLTALDSQDLKSVLHTADEGGTTCSTDRNTELGSELSVGKGRKSPVQTQPTSAVLDSDSGAAPRCLRYRTTGTELAATPRGSGQSRSRRGRWEGGLGWGIHVNPWLIHVNVWQKPLQYCKVISLKLIKKKSRPPRNMDLAPPLPSMQMPSASLLTLKNSLCSLCSTFLQRISQKKFTAICSQTWFTSVPSPAVSEGRRRRQGSRALTLSWETFFCLWIPSWPSEI